MSEPVIVDVDLMTEEEKAELNVMLEFVQSLERACKLVHKRNKKWWISLDTGLPIQRNVGELIALEHSELSESLEGYRKNLMDEHLPHLPNFVVEQADCLIRMMDTCEGLGYNLAQAWYCKMGYNAVRVDHTHEHRKTEHGKKF